MPIMAIILMMMWMVMISQQVLECRSVVTEGGRHQESR